jgi:hypothetical protein
MIDCNNSIKHFQYLIGKFCKDNNIPVFPETWDRISKWENNFDSTKYELFPYLHFDDGQLSGSKSISDKAIPFDEFLIKIKNCKKYDNFYDYSVRKEGDQFIFGCGEVTLTADEIRSFYKIHQILIDKEINLNSDDLKYISNLIK